MINKLNIFHVASECAPYAKVGGLADVIGSLPFSLQNDQNNISICLPLYKQLISYKKRVNLHSVLVLANAENVTVYKLIIPQSNISLFLFYNKKFISEGPIYLNSQLKTTNNNQERFAFFNLAVIEFLKKIKTTTNIVHCHDWHTGLIPYLIKKEPKLIKIKTVFTIHNIANQGIWEVAKAKKMNINIPKTNGNFINFIETGLRYSDFITTVSPTYAKEILTKKYGYNLTPLLNKRKNKLVGILNGINNDEFNPVTDKKIFYNYNIKKISVKKLNKTKLQKLSGLPIEPKNLLFGVVTRLYEQKGMDWLAEIMPHLKNLKVQIILLGTGDKLLEKKFKLLEKKYPKTLRVYIDFNLKLAQQIYAGSDAFLVPSRFEPCGLTQMIAMRYGTIPIVRATGGLKDSVIPYKKDKNTIHGTGFVFTDEKP